MKRIGFFLLLSSLFAWSLSAHEEQPPEQAAVQQAHPITYIVATPCSGLIETLRMMHQRGDMNVMHIPGNLAYCHVHNYLNIVQGWYRDDAPTSYAQAAAEIESMAQKGPVVVGENTHTAMEFLADNPDFANNPNVQYVFLIGDPHEITISYYDKKKDYFDQMPEEQIARSIGYKELHAFIASLRENGKRVFICETKSLYERPDTTIKALCTYLHILYKPEALHWSDLSANFKTFPFWTIENTNCSLEWHSDAIRSTEFTPSQTYKVDAEGNPTFEEIENEKHHTICEKAYEENKVYYDLIKEMMK